MKTVFNIAQLKAFSRSPYDYDPVFVRQRNAIFTWSPPGLVPADNEYVFDAADGGTWIQENRETGKAGPAPTEDLRCPLVDVCSCQPDGTVGAWETWSVSGTGATLADDTANKVRGIQSKKITATGGNAATVTCLLSAPVLAQSGLVFHLRVDDPTKLNNLQLRLFETSSGTTNFHYISVFQRASSKMFLLSAATTWYTIHIPAYRWKVSGTPTDWYGVNATHSIYRVQFILTPEAGQDVNVWVGSVVAPKPNKAILIWRFDDAMVSDYTITAPLLEKYGFRGYFAPWVEHVDAGALFCTSANIQDLAARGHEIGNHTISHPNLSGVTAGERHRQVGGGKRFVNGLGLRSETFAWPGNDGAFADAGAFISTYHSISYGITYRSELGLSSVSSPNLMAPSMSETTIPWNMVIPSDWHSLSAVNFYAPDGDDGSAFYANIDDVIRHNGCLTLYSHDIKVNPSAVGSNPTAAENIIAYARSKVDDGTLVCLTPQQYMRWAKAEDARNVVSTQWLT